MKYITRRAAEMLEQPGEKPPAMFIVACVGRGDDVIHAIIAVIGKQGCKPRPGERGIGKKNQPLAWGTRGKGRADLWHRAADCAFGGKFESGRRLGVRHRTAGGEIGVDLIDPHLVMPGLVRRAPRFPFSGFTQDAKRLWCAIDQPGGAGTCAHGEQDIAGPREVSLQSSIENVAANDRKSGKTSDDLFRSGR